MFDKMSFVDSVNNSGILPFQIFDYYWGLILLVFVYGAVAVGIYVLYGGWANMSKSWAESKILSIGNSVLILIFFSISSSSVAPDLYQVSAFNNLHMQTCSCGCEVRVVSYENCSQYFLFSNCIDFLFFVDACKFLGLSEIDLVEMMQMGLEDLKNCFYFFFLKSSFMGLFYERLMCVFIYSTNMISVSMEPLFMNNWSKVLFFFDSFFSSLSWFVSSVSLFNFNCVYSDFSKSNMNQKFDWGSFCFHKNLFSTKWVELEPQINELPVQLHRMVKILFEKYKFKDISFSDQELIDVKQGLVALYQAYVWVFVIYYFFFS